MIFVTLGTQVHQFKRLCLMVEQLQTTHDIIIQAGHTQFESSRHTVYDFPQNYSFLLQSADIIVCHGGVGSIIEGLRMEKKVIAVARLLRLNEHVDDHQTEIVNKLSKDGFIQSAINDNELQRCINSIGEFEPQKFITNTSSFNNELQQLIDLLI